MKTKISRESYHILIAVLISMAVIIIIWGIWFFPRGKSDISGSAGYSKFKRDLIGAFTIFAPDEQQENKVNIDDLRARVFGDVIER